MSALGQLPIRQLLGRNCPSGNCLGGNYSEWELRGWKFLQVGIFRMSVVSCFVSCPRWEYSVHHRFKVVECPRMANVLGQHLPGFNLSTCPNFLVANVHHGNYPGTIFRGNLSDRSITRYKRRAFLETNSMFLSKKSIGKWSDENCPKVTKFNVGSSTTPT